MTWSAANRWHAWWSKRSTNPGIGKTKRSACCATGCTPASSNGSRPATRPASLYVPCCWSTGPSTTSPRKHVRTRSRRSRVYNIFEGGYIDRPRPRRVLPWEITTERFVELLALLGPDINDDVVACLRAIADDSPEDLQPAVDKSWSAWAIALHDRHLLLELTETYYIDPGPGRGRRYNGIREHEFGRTLGQSLSGYGRGPFWVMTRFT